MGSQHQRFQDGTRDECDHAAKLTNTFDRMAYPKYALRMSI